MFMHGGFLHIIGNMLFLWIFGNNVEDAMGPLKFIAFYLLGGIAALALQVAFNTDSTVPTIGASGAIAGVLGGYILLYPRARVLTLIFIIFFVTFIEIPAVWVLGLWFLQQIYFGVADLSDPTGGGVAYFAHIGGFAFGLIFIRIFATRIRKQPEPRLPVY
jgi:membrane associated rhomboid family serine protease